MEISWGSRISKHMAPTKRWTAGSEESLEACGPASLACKMGLQTHALGDADLGLHTSKAWGPEFEFQHPCKKPGMAADACKPSTEKLRQTPPPKSSLAASVLKRTSSLFPERSGLMTIRLKAKRSSVLISSYAHMGEHTCTFISMHHTQKQHITH